MKKTNRPIRQSHIERIRLKQFIEARTITKIRKYMFKIARIYVKAVGYQDYQYLSLCVIKNEEDKGVYVMAHNNPERNDKHIEIVLHDKVPLLNVREKSAF